MKTHILFLLGATLLAFGATGTLAFARGYNVEKAGQASQTDVMQLGEAAVECEVIYKWTAQGKVREFLVTPSFISCKINGGIFKGSTATVTVGGKECMYKFQEPITVSGSPLKGEAAVTTEKQCVIEIKAVTCTIIVAGEQKHGKALFSNINETAGSLESELTAEVTGIVYTHTGLCTGLGTGSDGTYKGKVLLKGVAIE